MTLRRVAILTLACILPFAAGCKSAARNPAPQPTGSIYGSVTVTTPSPQPGPAQFTHHPDCASLKDYGPFRFEDQTLPRTVPPVFLWISAGLPSQPPPRTQAVLTQFQCRFQPQILGVLPGQPVDFTNADPFLAYFRVTPAISGNPSLALTLPPIKPGKVHTFSHPELLIPVTSPNRPWMKAWINVVPNSHFTLSGPDGRFTLRHLPPGTYTLSALRPGFPIQTRSISIKPGAATHATFTFPQKSSTPPSAKK